VCAVIGCSRDTTALDDSTPWMGCCGSMADDKADEVFESPESTDVLAVFVGWLEDGSSLPSV